MGLTISGFTVTVQVAEIVGSDTDVAVITAVPSLCRAVTLPDVETVATVASLVFHVILGSVASEGETVARRD